MSSWGTKDIRAFKVETEVETEVEVETEIENKDEVEIPRKLGMTYNSEISIQQSIPFQSSWGTKDLSAFEDETEVEVEVEVEIEVEIPRKLGMTY